MIAVLTTFYVLPPGNADVPSVGLLLGGRHSARWLGATVGVIALKMGQAENQGDCRQHHQKEAKYIGFNDVVTIRMGYRIDFIAL